MNPAIFQVQQATVGNRYSVGVSRQILQDLLRAAKRGLSVNHPFPVTKGRYELRKTDRVGEFPKSSIELECVCREEKLPPEKARNLPPAKWLRGFRR